MTTYEEADERGRLLKPFRENLERVPEDTNLLVSLHKIEFSRKREDYFEIAPNVFFSNLLYLLYVKRVAAGNDFESAKERAKLLLINELEKRRYALLSRMTLLNEDEIDSLDAGRKLILMDRAISFLEERKN
jgi:FAD synthase